MLKQGGMMFLFQSVKPDCNRWQRECIYCSLFEQTVKSKNRQLILVSFEEMKKKFLAWIGLCKIIIFAKVIRILWVFFTNTNFYINNFIPLL